MSIETSVYGFVEQIRRKYDYDDAVENVFIIFFREGKVVHEEIAGTGSENTASFDIKRTLRNGIITEADSMIILHNHTSHNLNPSVTDMETTEILMSLCYILDIHLIAHIIFNGDGEKLIYAGDYNRFRRSKKGKRSSKESY